jgi:hydroxyacylglutathione hydrolase
MNPCERLFDNLYVVFTGLEGLGEFVSTYLLVTSQGRALIIDPGPRSSVERVYGALRELGLEKSLKYVITTHVHLDHAGGATRLAKLTRAAIVVHPRGLIHIRDPVKLWESSKKVQGDIVELYGMPDKGEDVEILEAKDGETIKLDDIDLEILYTPGHASHHMSVFWTSKSILFTGDSAGLYIPEIDAIIPNTPPPFRYDLYIDSLMKMMKKKPKMLAYAHEGVRGNGEEALERHYDQMRIWLEILISIDEKSLNDINCVMRRLAEEDVFLKSFLEYYTKPQYWWYKYACMHSLVGFIEEVKRIKTSWRSRNIGMLVSHKNS